MDGINSPVFVLAPPSTLAAFASAELGQHPQLYGLPETQLFGVETMAEWWNLCARESFPMAHGLLRAVAQLFYGRQTGTTVQRARGWLRRRSSYSTGMVFEMLAEKVQPLVLVDRSPSIVYRAESLQRVAGMFPGARFIHLVQHPRSYSEWVMNAIGESEESGPAPYWLLHLASFPSLAARDGWAEHSLTDLDPQKGWYVLHMNIIEFLSSVPDVQHARISVEDWFSDGEASQIRILRWLGLRDDEEALEQLAHADLSPYASLGPAGARFGNDPFFLQNPGYRPSVLVPKSLIGPLSWRPDGQGFLPEVRRLAEDFGYQ